jgi:DNA polymerase-3 subunit epsilon
MANIFCSRAFAERKYLLALSVLVCHIEGRILLYNARARRMLEAGHGAGMAAGTAAIGLGRSVFGVLERGLIAHALE